MDIFILELVSNHLTVPVKIDGMQQHEETRSLLRIGDQLRASAGFLCRAFMEHLRSWVALCLMDIFILELVSNHLTVPVKIDGMQQHEKRVHF